MDIKSFQLDNFRNYCDQKIEFQKGINLLVGENGQGKTNILEGINYLLTGKSYRAKQEQELIRWGEKNFYLKANCQIKDRTVGLESYFETGKKVMKINKLSIRRLSDYVGTVNAVFFSPDDLNIVKKSPNERRRFLDLLIAQVKPGHVLLMNTYIKIVKQKNNLLRNEKRQDSLKKQLPVWNEQLVDAGSKIILNRWSFAEKLNQFCQPIFKSIFSVNDQIDLSYYSLGKKDINEALQTFQQLLEQKMNMEIEKRMILIGPHRDDLNIELNNKPAKLFASQGQQRSSVLSLKLAEMEIIKKRRIVFRYYC
jgi:DNA replication and repair protein RecF